MSDNIYFTVSLLSLNYLAKHIKSDLFTFKNHYIQQRKKDTFESSTVV